MTAKEKVPVRKPSDGPTGVWTVISGKAHNKEPPVWYQLNNSTQMAVSPNRHCSVQSNSPLTQQPRRLLVCDKKTDRKMTFHRQLSLIKLSQPFRFISQIVIITSNNCYSFEYIYIIHSIFSVIAKLALHQKQFSAPKCIHKYTMFCDPITSVTHLKWSKMIKTLA